MGVGKRSHACCPSHPGSGQHKDPRLKCRPYKRTRWRSSILLPLFPSQFPNETHLLHQVTTKAYSFGHSLHLYWFKKKKVSIKVTLKFPTLCNRLPPAKGPKTGRAEPTRFAWPQDRSREPALLSRVSQAGAALLASIWNPGEAEPCQ